MTGARGADPAKRVATDVTLLVALAVFEVGALGAVAGAPGRGPLLAASLAAAAVGAAVGVWRVRRSLPSGRRALGMTLAMNLVTALLALGGAEIVLRLVATRLPHGTFVGSRLLLPRRWEDVAAYNRWLLAHARPNISYFVPDDRLGWTIGPSRVSSDGLYASSAEGIRSADPSASYAATRPAHRIALVGDSYTFGLEVPFEETWGRRLETALGEGFQVLNFGVDGYGIDQACLRFERDVRPFAPDVVVFGFIRHDLQRTMAVYPFIDFPAWGFPFSKPRLTRAAGGGRVEARNLPLAAPETIFAARRIEDLPFLELDAGFQPGEWRPRLYDGSYVLRWLLAGFGGAAAEAAANSEPEMIALNAEILSAAVRRAREDGAVPLVVYFPSRYVFRGAEGGSGHRLGAFFDALRERGVEVLDTTSCLERLGTERLFLSGRPHYSPEGNAALASCLLPAVSNAAAR